MLSCIILEDRVPAKQPPRKRRAMVYGLLAKTKLIGRAKLAGQALMCFATYNLVRMGSIGGWWDAHHACNTASVPPK